MCMFAFRRLNGNFFHHFLFARLVTHNFPPAQTCWLLNFQTSQISKTSTFYLGFGLSDPQPWECPHSEGLHTLVFPQLFPFPQGPKSSTAYMCQSLKIVVSCILSNFPVSQNGRLNMGGYSIIALEFLTGIYCRWQEV